uniref:Uncharacterized protein n=1 Tax=Octopus bimaculoides TaxID=37653 RepID=A0A0L8FVV5_OCTBM
MLTFIVKCLQAKHCKEAEMVCVCVCFVRKQGLHLTFIKIKISTNKCIERNICLKSMDVHCLED